MSTLYDKYMEGVKDKYGVQRLVTETRPAPSAIVLPGGTTPSRHEKEKLQEYKDRYNMPHGLELHGRAAPKETTLEDYVTEKEREAYKGMKLAVGSTSYKGKPVRIWFTIGR
jgi:hypothetical protein